MPQGHDQWKNSGLMTTQADYWVFNVGALVIIPTNVLRAVWRSAWMRETSPRQVALLETTPPWATACPCSGSLRPRPGGQHDLGTVRQRRCCCLLIALGAPSPWS